MLGSRLRAVWPLARSSTRARSAQSAAPSASKRSSAARRCSRASTRRRSAAQELAERELGARPLERAPAALVLRRARRVNRRSASAGSAASSARQCSAAGLRPGRAALPAHGSKARARRGGVVLARAHRRLDAVQRVPDRCRPSRAARGRARARPPAGPGPARARQRPVRRCSRGRAAARRRARGSRRPARGTRPPRRAARRAAPGSPAGGRVIWCWRVPRASSRPSARRAAPRPVAGPDVAQRHPRQRLREQADHPVFAGARRGRRCSSSTARSSHRKRPTGLTRPSRSGRPSVGRSSTSESVVRKHAAAASKSRGEVRAQAGAGAAQEARDRRVARPRAPPRARDGDDRLAVAREGRAPAREAQQVQRASGSPARPRRPPGQDLARVGRHAAGQLDEPAQPVGVGAEDRLPDASARARSNATARGTARAARRSPPRRSAAARAALVGGQRGGALERERGRGVGAAARARAPRLLELVDDGRVGLDAAAARCQARRSARASPTSTGASASCAARRCESGAAW